MQLPTLRRSPPSTHSRPKYNSERAEVTANSLTILIYIARRRTCQGPAAAAIGLHLIHVERGKPTITRQSVAYGGQRAYPSLKRLKALSCSSPHHLAARVFISLPPLALLLVSLFVPSPHIPRGNQWVALFPPSLQAATCRTPPPILPRTRTLRKASLRPRPH